MAKDVVVHGATIKCSESDLQSFLKARNLNMEVDGKFVATVADHEPTENILPFGICKHPKWKNKPCKPVTPSPWEPGEKSVEFAGEVVLDVRSKCECKIGGTIEIVDPGQSHPFFFVNCEGYSPAALKTFALKQRAALIKEQMDAENEAEAGQRSLLNQLANTVLETGKEFSGYNDALRTFDALRRGDLKGAAWHALSASPFKAVKGAALASKAARGGRRAAARKGATGATQGPKRWKRNEVNGKRVYQRDDLIDPHKRDARGRTNLERMQQGDAPVGPDGHSINLHHTTQRDSSPVAEVTRTFHQQNSRVLHIYPNTVPSDINRPAFDSWRESYWSTRAKDFTH